MSRLLRFFRDSWQELKKVNWPTPQEARNLTVIVIVVSAGIGAAIGVLDYVFGMLGNRIVGISG